MIEKKDFFIFFIFYLLNFFLFTESAPFLSGRSGYRKQ